MQIAIILGSVRTGRQSDQVCHYLAKALDQEKNIEAKLLDLADYDLPIYKEKWADQDPPPKGLYEFSLELKQADAIILASPEYHGSYTGVLKNALDHYWKEFARKPIGVVATGSGKFGGVNASTHMQQLILSLGAYPMPFKLLIPFIEDAFDENGTPINEKLKQNIHKFIKEFTWFASALVTYKDQ